MRLSETISGCAMNTLIDYNKEIATAKSIVQSKHMEKEEKKNKKAEAKMSEGDAKYAVLCYGQEYDRTCRIKNADTYAKLRVGANGTSLVSTR